jgi:hypothetical protein
MLVAHHRALIAPTQVREESLQFLCPCSDRRCGVSQRPRSARTARHGCSVFYSVQDPDFAGCRLG